MTSVAALPGAEPGEPCVDPAGDPHGDPPVEPAAVLAAVRAAQEREDQAGRDKLRLAAAWAALHPAESVDPDGRSGREEPVPVAGPGAPLVADFAVVELAAVLGMTPYAARRLIGDAVELRHRLPQCWRRIEQGEVPGWRARMVARRTIDLAPEPAADVDAQVAPLLNRLGVARLGQIIEAASLESLLARLPDDEQTRQTAISRHSHYARIRSHDPAYPGTIELSARLCAADGAELDGALTAGAGWLAEQGWSDSVDVRRAAVLGMLARGERPWLESDTSGATRRQVVLYLHLGSGPLGRFENTGAPILADQVAEWCGLPTAQVTLRPVIDLNDSIRAEQYEIPSRLKEHVDLRDGGCCFPWCTRPARRLRGDGYAADHDHIHPFDRGGGTSTDNLAPLCRKHHRLKTHGSWDFRVVEPGVYWWRSPYDYTFVRDPSGTREVTVREEPR